VVLLVVLNWSSTRSTGPGGSPSTPAQTADGVATLDAALARGTAQVAAGRMAFSAQGDRDFAAIEAWLRTLVPSGR
jgi:hypothetical protein